MAEKKQQKKTAKSHRSAKAGSKEETVRKKSARTKKPLLKKTPESKPGESDCAESQLVDGVAKVLDSVNCELSRNAQNVARGLVQQIGKGSITNLKRLADLRKEFGAKRGARNGLQELFEAIGREMESDPDNPVKTV